MKREGEAIVTVEHDGEATAAAMARFALEALEMGSLTKASEEAAASEWLSAADSKARFAQAVHEMGSPTKSSEEATTGEPMGVSKLSQSKVASAAGGSTEDLQKAKAPDAKSAEPAL